MGNWFKFPRNINEWQHYSDSKVLHVMIEIVRAAQYKDCTRKGVKVKRGQSLLSVSAISDNTGLSPNTIRNAIDKLFESKDIKKRATKQGTLFSINQSSIWYGCSMVEQQIEQPTEQQIDEPIYNIDSIDDIDNNKIEKKKIIKEKKFQKPSIAEIDSYIKEKGYSVDAERFFNNYDSKGWDKFKKLVEDWRKVVDEWAERSNKPKQDVKQDTKQEERKILDDGTWIKNGKRYYDYEGSETEIPINDPPMPNDGRKYWNFNHRWMPY